MPDTVAPAPASAPAAPSSAPAAAPASPAPAPAAATPPSPAAPAPTVENAGSISEAWERAVASVPIEEEQRAEEEAAVEEPAAEVPAAESEEPAAEPAAEPEAVAEQPTAETEPVPELILEDGDFGPKELGDFLKKDAAVEKFFNDHPEVKNRVFAMARRDQETRAIREIAPTVELAKEMQRGHSLFSDIDNRFLNATTPEGFKSFMDMWVEQALMVDDTGQPIKGEDGKYRIHPALTSVIENIHANRNGHLLGEMERTGKIPAPVADSTLKVIDFLSKSADDQVKEAAQILKDRLTPSSSSATGELPDELKPYSESLKKREQELNEREASQQRTRQESEKAAHAEALRQADFKAAEACLAQVNPLLKKAGLTEFEQKAARERIGNLLDQKLRENAMYQTARNRLEAGTLDAARSKELTKLILTYTQELLGPITAGVLREATHGKLARQTETDNRVAEQQNRSRTDPRGTSAGSQTGQPQTTAQIEEALVNEYKAAHNGEMPDRRWVTQKMWDRMNTGKGQRRTA